MANYYVLNLYPAFFYLEAQRFPGDLFPALENCLLFYFIIYSLELHDQTFLIFSNGDT